MKQFLFTNWPHDLFKASRRWPSQLLLTLLISTSAWAQAPTWQAALTLGQTASNISVVNGTATDATGNVYVTGYFSGQVAFGSNTLTSAGGNDMFVARYNPGTSTWDWAKSGGGTGNDEGYGIAADGTHIFVTGYFFSSSSANIAGQPLIGAGSYDAFVAAYTTAGANAWASSSGGTNIDGGYSIVTDGTYVYVTGSFYSGSNVNIAGQMLTGAGDYDMFVAAYTMTGSGAWASSGGGNRADYGYGIATDGICVYVTGYFTSANNASFAGQALAGAGGHDAFVASYTTAGAGAWATSGGGTNDDYGSSIATDGTHVYVTGSFTSSTSASFGGQTLNGMGNTDIFVAAYTTAGANAWATGGGGTDNDFGSSIVTDGTHVYLIGHFTSGTNTSFAGQTLTGAGAFDLFVAAYTTAGAYAWAASSGGTGNDYGSSIAINGTQVYVGGYVALPATFGSITLPGSNIQVGVLARLAAPTLGTLSPATSLKAQVLAYPNPAHGTLTVQHPAGATAVGILYNTLGQSVRHLALPAAETVLDLHDLAPGIYTLRLTVNGQPLTRRVVLD